MAEKGTEDIFDALSIPKIEEPTLIMPEEEKTGSSAAIEKSDEEDESGRDHPFFTQKRPPQSKIGFQTTFMKHQVLSGFDSDSDSDSIPVKRMNVWKE